MQEKKLKAFVKQNAPLIYTYMNSEILKDIGTLHPDFFVKLIEDFFSKEDERKNSSDIITVDTLSYFILTEVLGEAKKAYTFFRKDTMTLDELYKEVRVYYNYARFYIQDDSFCINLIQTKAGVTAFDEEIVKFTKQIPMKTTGIEEFISKNSAKQLNDILKKIEEDIDNILKLK